VAKQKIMEESRLKKISLLVGVAILLVALPGVWFLKGKFIKDNITTTQQQETVTPEIPVNINLYQTSVQVFSWGFSNRKISVEQGGAVAWIVKDNSEHQIVIEGGEAPIRGQGALQRSDMFLVTFSSAGTYTFKDLNNPDFKGTLIVEQQKDET